MVNICQHHHSFSSENRTNMNQLLKGESLRHSEAYAIECWQSHVLSGAEIQCKAWCSIPSLYTACICTLNSTHIAEIEIFAETTMMYLILDSVTPALSCLDAVRNCKAALLCTAVLLSTWSISNAHSIAMSPWLLGTDKQLNKCVARLDWEVLYSRPVLQLSTAVINLWFNNGPE